MAGRWTARLWSCGGDSGAFCHRVRGAGGGEGAFWSDPGGSVRVDIALQREDTAEGGEKHRVVGDVEKEKKRNGPTNAGTCTSVVRAHRGADKKALPPKNQHRHHHVITSTLFEMNSTCMRLSDLNFSCLSTSITSPKASVVKAINVSKSNIADSVYISHVETLIL